MLKAYTARKMTGVNSAKLVRDARETRRILFAHGIKALDPVESEMVSDSQAPLQNPEPLLREYWQRDKRMIRDAHVLLDLTGPEKSEGTAHEIGYARYALWKPVVRVWTGLGPNVARFEDDFIADSQEEAARFIQANYGTWTKRLVWRLKMLNRCLPKFVWMQLQEFCH